jgi:hypothetical protein
MHNLVFHLEAVCSLSDIYFEVDNEDALLESIMGEDKIAVPTLFIPSAPLFLCQHEFLSMTLMNLFVHVAESWMQHVIIGLDNTQVFADLDLAAASGTDQFAQEEDDDDEEEDDGSDDDEESDFDDDFNDVVRTILKLLIAPLQALERLLLINLHDGQEGVFAVDGDEDEDDDGEDDEDDDLPSWSNLETVNSCHPLYFARMIVEVHTVKF